MPHTFIPPFFICAGRGLETILPELYMFGVRHSGKLHVGDTLHRAFIDVSEAGTEAAAATAPEARRVSGPPLYLGKRFVADRPFIFAIQDDGTGALLFMGRVMDPTT
ncbi:hypothetical protein IBTHAUMO2_250005 [Nitrosopumilaceae archaeon]|nr:hypothetical protein [Nitrosopumilus sp.]MDA8009162.1 hypothetical protein [Alphaproteobacteria bacterium]CAI9831460.1 hypothetical protein IBTHAUMO2_250005 [Nitrosopumilaceae archaeon]MDA7945477.1 hypothetical protein [Nitrosopumilus sp.]MDA7955227.1 hypothetical protein [Nitrosopumilus sp.]